MIIPMSNDPKVGHLHGLHFSSQTKWPGEWDGRFGRGIQYADLETYFVANDAQDQNIYLLILDGSVKDPSGNVNW